MPCRAVNLGGHIESSKSSCPPSAVEQVKETEHCLFAGFNPTPYITQLFLVPFETIQIKMHVQASKRLAESCLIWQSACLQGE